MNISSIVSNLISFLRLGLIHPWLLLTAYTAKKDKKTYLTYSKLLSLATSFREVQKRSSGTLDVAEFGVGMGGSASVLGWLVGHFGGTLTLYDVFGRIPPPTEPDGAAAKDRFQKILMEEDPDQYYGNIPNLIDLIQSDLTRVCRAEQIEFIQGKYEDTLPDERDRAYHLVHIDCDWYESTNAVFCFLKENLSPGAIIQLDDYAYWPGPKMVFDQAEWLRGAKRWLVAGALVIDTVSI
jgi:hypothetical protein